jgi:hypothetical protein
VAVDPLHTALIDEALKKSSLVWISLPDGGHSRAFWHAWTEGRLYLLTGGEEQPDPGFRERTLVDVLVRSKDTWERLVVFRARTSLLLSTDDDWPAATAELAKSRLNLPGAEAAPQRWANIRSYHLYRLTPTGEILEGPGAVGGDYPDDSRRAAPVPTPASTRGRLPWVLHKRSTRRRPLS